MKIFYLIVLFLSLFTSTTIAQPPSREQRQEKIEALRIAFLTRQLELTPDEAKKFWPVHDLYQADIEKLLKEYRDKKGDEIELEEKLLNVRKKYKPDFLKTISEEKFNKMLRAERDFREMIRKEMERRRGGGQPGGK
jgi:hypothetical protein